MKKFVASLLNNIIPAIAAGSNNINYGYNIAGDITPRSSGNQRINYGYDISGNVAPISIGGKRITYGYNVAGDVCPRYIGDEKVEYGLNFAGNIVPTSIGGKRIEYGYNLNPIASDRKENITKEMAPDFYKETCEWFNRIYSAIRKTLKQNNNVALIETYYEQKLDDVIWDFEEECRKQ